MHVACRFSLRGLESRQANMQPAQLGRGEEDRDCGALWAGSIWAVVPARRPRFREGRGVNCAPSGFGLIDQRSLLLTIVASGDFFLRGD